MAAKYTWYVPICMIGKMYNHREVLAMKIVGILIATIKKYKVK